MEIKGSNRSNVPFQTVLFPHSENQIWKFMRTDIQRRKITGMFTKKRAVLNLSLFHLLILQLGPTHYVTLQYICSMGCVSIPIALHY